MSENGKRYNRQEDSNRNIKVESGRRQGLCRSQETNRRHGSNRSQEFDRGLESNRGQESNKNQESNRSQGSYKGFGSNKSQGHYKNTGNNKCLENKRDRGNIKDQGNHKGLGYKIGQRNSTTENNNRIGLSIKRTDVNRSDLSDNRTKKDRNITGRDNGNSRGRKGTLQKGTCPYLRECGGCNILRQSYEAELMNKQKLVEGLLKVYCKVEPIIGMKQPEHYRNKVHVVFDHDRKGNPVSGVYEEGTHRVVPVEACLIHNKKADEIITTIRGMLKSFKIKTYDEDNGFGLLRHVMIRVGYVSGEIMVVLVLTSPIFPSKNNFVKALLAKHPEVTTIVLNVNDKVTSMVLGEKEQVIYGKGYIEDSLCGKIFRISAKSFYQVNPAQTELLYQKAIEYAGLTGKETIIDAYCGTGTIGIIASDHAKRVIGVELSRDAVKDAVINAKRNNASNIVFYNTDAGDFLSEMAEVNESADVIFMDPPRTGSTEKFLDAAATLKAGKIVYVSCNPVTLERDINYLQKKGYKAVKAQPVDMFPWTEHVECVIMMTYCGSKGK